MFNGNRALRSQSRGKMHICLLHCGCACRAVCSCFNFGFGAPDTPKEHLLLSSCSGGSCWHWAEPGEGDRNLQLWNSCSNQSSSRGTVLLVSSHLLLRSALVIERDKPAHCHPHTGLWQWDPQEKVSSTLSSPWALARAGMSPVYLLCAEQCSHRASHTQTWAQKWGLCCSAAVQWGQASPSLRTVVLQAMIWKQLFTREAVSEWGCLKSCCRIFCHAGTAGSGFLLLLLWFQNVCACVGQSLVAQTGANPLCSFWLLSLLSILQVPVTCQPVSIIPSNYPFSLHIGDNFAHYSHGCFKLNNIFRLNRPVAGGLLDGGNASSLLWPLVPRW